MFGGYKMGSSKKDETKYRKDLLEILGNDFSERENVILNLLNHAKLGMVVVNQEHQILGANQRFADMLGYTQDELKTMYTWDYDANISMDDIKSIYSDISKVDTTFEAQHRRKDGSVYDVEVSGTGISVEEFPGKNLILCFCQDITERKNAERQLIKSENKFRSFVESLADTVFVVNIYGECKYISPNCEETFGYAQEELSETGLLKIIQTENIERFITRVRNAFDEKIVFTYECQLRHKDNSLEWYTVKFSYLDEFNSDEQHLICIAHNINERIENEKKLEVLSMQDHLTGIYNRAYYSKQLNEFDKQQLYPLSIIIFDIDRLKYINDNFGHLYGDDVLVRCADVVSGVLRKGDVFARIGGDEFSILLPNTTKKRAKEIMKRIDNAIKNNNMDSDNPTLSISLGVATKTDDSISTENLLKHADEILYIEKRNKQIVSTK